MAAHEVAGRPPFGPASRCLVRSHGHERSIAIARLTAATRAACPVLMQTGELPSPGNRPRKESDLASDRDASVVTRLASPEAKIQLFRSLFRGREDVYPRRFESRKTGRAGYQPACGNEWVRGVCEKPKIKCSECPHQRFLPVTDEVIRWHLSGQDVHGHPFVAGVYPMLLDECCHFLAIDLDKEHWHQDAQAVIETCGKIGLPVAVERSRSGNGAHLWMFFEEAIPARLARNLGSHVLTETMESRPDLDLHSYDRLFPNQDTLPKGGFGNLIALPLQREPRQRGHSVFLDAAFEPYVDQWAYLATLPKVPAKMR